MRIRVTTVLLSLIVLSCERSTLEIEITESQLLADIPSASGMAKTKEGYYAIGDDSPFFFWLNNDFEITQQQPFYAQKDYDVVRIPKEIKPDYEGMEVVESQVLVFGSGSKTPERDVLMILDIGNNSSISTYDLSSFYGQLRSLTALKNSELNIEGVAYRNNRLYLLNRSNNVILAFDYKAFKLYIDNVGAFPTPTITKYSLPTILGKPAGFSGATIPEDLDYLLFTASVEDTGNAYDDGAVLGSFVGMIKLDGEDLSSEVTTVKIPTDQPLKVETITVAERLSANSLEVVLATDSDGGDSMVLSCVLNWH